jgi:hypothetical protein
LFFFVCSLDPFAKKEWYDVKAPASFPTKQICKTVVTKTQGTRTFSFHVQFLSIAQSPEFLNLVVLSFLSSFSHVLQYSSLLASLLLILRWLLVLHWFRRIRPGR